VHCLLWDHPASLAPPHPTPPQQRAEHPPLKGVAECDAANGVAERAVLALRDDALKLDELLEHRVKGAVALNVLLLELGCVRENVWVWVVCGWCVHPWHSRKWRS